MILRSWRRLRSIQVLVLARENIQLKAKETLYDCWFVMCFFYDMSFYKVWNVCVFLMGDETLGDCVDNDSLNGQIFESAEPVSGDRKPKYYVVDMIEGNNLRVFPVDYVRGKPVARKGSVGVLYSDHVGDPICVDR